MKKNKTTTTPSMIEEYTIKSGGTTPSKVVEQHHQIKWHTPSNRMENTTSRDGDINNYMNRYN